MCRLNSFLHAVALIAIVAHLPGALGFWGGGVELPDVQNCLSSILGVNGCLEEIMSVVWTFEPRSIGAACCRAFLNIDEDCLPKIFPVGVSFPLQLVKNHCVS